MTKRMILVPLDGSGFGEAAIPYAVRAAERLDAGLNLLSVYEDHPTVAGWPLDPTKMKEAWDAYQADVTARIRKVTDLDIEGSIVGGQAARGTEDFAQQTEPVMVVMSTHGRGPLSRAWLGSVADRMVRHASMPVLLIKPTEADEENGEFQIAPPFSKVVVALDGSRRAETSLGWAQRLASPDDAKLAIVRAVPEPHMPSVYLPDATALREEAIRKGTDEADRYLETLRQHLVEDGKSVCAEVFPGGNVARDILRFAERTESDLIVMASHGRGGLARMVLGSVSDKIVRGADTPVLVVRTA